jgi:hypothetical protein
MEAEYTAPSVPSTITVCPVLSTFVPMYVPVTVGTCSSLAHIAEVIIEVVEISDAEIKKGVSFQ